MPSFFTDIKRGDLLVQFVIVLPDSTCRAECINQKSLKPTATANLRYSDRTSLSDNKTQKEMVGLLLNWKDVSCSKKGFLVQFFLPYSMSRYEPLTGCHNLHLSLFHVIFRAHWGLLGNYVRVNIDSARFQASTAVQMCFSFFWDVKQHRLVYI